MAQAGCMVEVAVLIIERSYSSRCIELSHLRFANSVPNLCLYCISYKNRCGDLRSEYDLASRTEIKEFSNHVYKLQQ